MSKRTTRRVGPERRVPPAGIDPQGNDIVLHYVGPGVVRYAPARDLSGSDIARIGYHRRFQDAIDLEAPKPADHAGFGDVAEIADELVSSGIWSLDVPRGSDDGEAPAEDGADAPTEPTTTPEPDAPAEAPEA
jgi:hypothetical protein